MNDHTPYTERGSALLEALLGVALLGLFLVILMGSVAYLEQSTLRANQHMQALLMSDEGLEAVHSMRNTDFALLTDGAHGLTRGNGVWEFAGASDQDGAFVRTITISHENASTTKVNVLIRWGRDGQTTDTSLETYLTDWHSTN